MLYFILNPASHSAEKTTVWSQVQTRLHQQAIPYRVFATRYAGHAGRLAEEISGRDPQAVIICIGGDGSLHEILNGLLNLSTVTFGVIPNGSGNDFARGMKIPADPDRALDAILSRQRIVPMDLGLLKTGGRSHRFGVSAGIGFDAAVCQESVSSSIKDTLNLAGIGELSYTAIALRQILLYQPGPMEIDLDGDRHFRFRDVFFTCIMNQKYEGGGLMMTPDARPDDGVLDLMVVGDGLTKPQLVSALPLARTGRHVRYPHIHFLKCRKLTITADKKRPVHLDGESGGMENILSAEILPEKLRVITG
jgi:YegS/Rv2252/BmrU family lipid kinase